MENSEINKINSSVGIDIRQSEEWSKYLESIGWNCEQTQNGIWAAFRKVGFGVVSKVQRPGILTQQDLDQIKELCLKNKTMFVKVEPSLGQDIELLKNNEYFESSFPFLPPATIVIDLTLSEKELFSNLSKNARYSVRRSKREGSKFEIYQNPDNEKIETFFKLTKHTEKDRRFPAASLEDLKNKVKFFGDESWISLIKDSDGDYVAGNFFVAHEKSVWFMHSGTSPKGRKGFDGHKLMWDSIVYFKNKGYRSLDLEGRDDDRFPTFTKRWGGFSFFKEKFGGADVYFSPPYVKLLSPLLKGLHKIYGRNLPL